MTDPHDRPLGSRLIPPTFRTTPGLCGRSGAYPDGTSTPQAWTSFQDATCLDQRATSAGHLKRDRADQIRACAELPEPGRRDADPPGRRPGIGGEHPLDGERVGPGEEV